MVDSEFAPMHDKIKAAIAKISPLPIKYLINTHFHGDHTGGNELFHKDGATIVAQDNIRVRLAAGTTNGLTGNKTPPAPADACRPRPMSAAPRRCRSAAATRSSAMSTMPTPTATPGSISRDANVLATGDIFGNTGRYNTIDFPNGGDIRGLIRALDAYIKAANDTDQDRSRPWHAREQGQPGRVPRNAGHLPRSRPETVRRGQERSMT